MGAARKLEVDVQSCWTNVASVFECDTGVTTMTHPMMTNEVKERKLETERTGCDPARLKYREPITYHEIKVPSLEETIRLLQISAIESRSHDAPHVSREDEREEERGYF